MIIIIKSVHVAAWHIYSRAGKWLRKKPRFLGFLYKKPLKNLKVQNLAF